MQPKDYFIETLVERGVIKPGMKILELGSGQSRAILSFLKKYPETVYIGVEPSPVAAGVAKELLQEFKNAKVYNQLAYDEIKDCENFDICISLSVLEHVKQLDKFLINSIKYVRPGAQIIHRYDLGHALYPCSMKEKFQIFLGNNFPAILPEDKFVRYLSEQEVCETLKNNGAQIENITYSQMPNHKAFLKVFKIDTDAKAKLARKVWEWEDEVSPYVKEIEQRQRELLFPAVTVWAKKNS